MLLLRWFPFEGFYLVIQTLSLAEPALEENSKNISINTLTLRLCVVCTKGALYYTDETLYYIPYVAPI